MIYVRVTEEEDREIRRRAVKHRRSAQRFLIETALSGVGTAVCRAEPGATRCGDGTDWVGQVGQQCESAGEVGEHEITRCPPVWMI